MPLVRVEAEERPGRGLDDLAAGLDAARCRRRRARTRAPSPGGRRAPGPARARSGRRGLSPSSSGARPASGCRPGVSISFRFQRLHRGDPYPARGRARVRLARRDPRRRPLRARPDRRRTATSSAPRPARPRRSSSTRAATRRSCGSSSPGLGARCAAILITHGHWDHLGGVADLAEGTGAPVYMPEGERAVARATPRPRPRRACSRAATTADTSARRAARRSSSPGICVRDARRSRATRPAHLAYYADGCLFSGDLLFAGSVGRIDLPGARLGHARSSRSALLVERFPPETVVYSGPRPADDARRRARPQPVPRRAARLVTTFEAPRGTHDILPSEQPLWRQVTGEVERLCALYGYRRIQTPGVRGHRALPADVGRGLRRRAEGDVHVRGPRRPLADAAPRGHRADRRAYLEHGLHREPQPVKLYTIAHDVPLRGAAARAATASTGSSRSRRSARPTRRSTPR